jgi:hypothetical protein
MRIPVFVMTAVLVALVALPATATLLNGDCELGIGWQAPTTGTLSTLLSNWTFDAPTGGTFANFRCGLTTVTFHGGHSSGGVWMSNAGATKIGTFYQTVADLTPNATYSISAWLRGNSVTAGTSYAKIGAQAGAAVPKSYASYTWSDSVNSDTWAEKSVQATSSATGTIDIMAWLATGTVTGTAQQPLSAFDDVTITLIPEPGSMIALLSGLVGLVGFGVRRRK